MILVNKLLLSTVAGIISVAGYVSTFNDKIDLANENTSLKENLAVYREEYIKQAKQIDSIKVKCYTPQDTVIAFVNGYRQAIEDKAGSFHISDGKINMVIADGKYKYWFEEQVSSLKNTKKLITGSGIVEDASIHKK